MKKLAPMTVLRSLRKLHEAGKPEDALELINELINEAKNGSTAKSQDIRNH